MQLEMLKEKCGGDKDIENGFAKRAVLLRLGQKGQERKEFLNFVEELQEKLDSVKERSQTRSEDPLKDS